ncbi:hypothetical protein LZ554_002131 [Drepanopeziza brunnea f. sp. 'monogermtubi']|nr:hypothetical protein LZ554_002131 [Drepanopeziza brunnea f. sp. 'monogermtubi']
MSLRCPTSWRLATKEARGGRREASDDKYGGSAVGVKQSLEKLKDNFTHDTFAINHTSPFASPRTWPGLDKWIETGTSTSTDHIALRSSRRMRLFLLPISTRRTLIYCQRLNVTTAEQKKGWGTWGISKAEKLWTDWEKKESGWQKWVVDKGNIALKRIPYEEWGLKSIPPLSARRKSEELQGQEMVEVLFPTTLIPQETVMGVLRKLGTERQSLHKQRIIYSIVGMPLVAPFALVPVIPNLPFFYLVYRAWSHWKALSGSKHVEFLVNKKLIKATPSKILDDLYSDGQRPFDAASETSEEPSSHKGGIDSEERMVLHKSNGKKIAEGLEVPELEIELDRAVWQVETALWNKKERKEEQRDLKEATPEPKGKL